MRSLLVSALAMVAIALLTAASADDTIADKPITVSSPLLSKKPVLEWSVGDVEQWMNTTLGYPEYSAYVRKHQVDGITLIEMDAAEFETFFPVENPLHVIKFRAHTKQLRGRCSCRDDTEDGITTKSTDFWSHMRAHSVRTWLAGGSAMFFPRLAMAGSYVLDRDVYYYLTASTGEGDVLEGDNDGDDKAQHTVSSIRRAIYWLSFIFAPDVYLACQTVRLVPGNYVLMPFFFVYFIAQAYNEYMLLYMMYRGTAFEPSLGYLKRLWVVFSYTSFAPLAGLVVGYLCPVWLQYVCVVALVLHSVMVLVGLAYLHISGFPTDGAAEAAEGSDKTE